MVRAGAVTHPMCLKFAGFRAIQNPPARCGGVDLNALKDSPGIKTVAGL
jgi:hypothetical protein